jgi:hypothetical protein
VYTTTSEPAHSTQFTSELDHECIQLQVSWDSTQFTNELDQWVVYSSWTNGVYSLQVSWTNGWYTVTSELG